MHRKEQREEEDKATDLELLDCPDVPPEREDVQPTTHSREDLQ